LLDCHSPVVRNVVTLCPVLFVCSHAISAGLLLCLLLTVCILDLHKFDLPVLYIIDLRQLCARCC